MLKSRWSGGFAVGVVSLPVACGGDSGGGSGGGDSASMNVGVMIKGLIKGLDNPFFAAE